MQRKKPPPPTLALFVGTNPWKTCTSLYWGKWRVRRASKGVQMFFNQPPSTLCPKPLLCYLHSPFRGCCRLMGAEAWGRVVEGKREAARPWNLCIPPEKVGGIFTPPQAPDSPSFQCFPGSIINCAEAAGVREKERERGVMPCYLTYLSFLNKSQ